MNRGRIRKNLKFFRGENEKITSLLITRYIGINDGGTYRSSQKVDAGQKEVSGLNDLPPPPPEVNVVL